MVQERAKEFKRKVGRSKLNKCKHNKPHIVIVEDDEGLRQLLFDLLCENYRISNANHGLSALKILKRNAVDLIITDISMPEFDGIELLSYLREDDKLSEIPVIVLSADTNSNTHLKSLELGAIDFITKPFNIDHILLKVKNFLKKSNPIAIDTQPSSKDQSSKQQDHRFIKRYENLLDCNYSNSKFTVESCAKYMNMSKRQLQRRVKMFYARTPSEQLKHFRLIKGRQLLLQGFSIAYTYQAIGLKSQSHFSRAFKSVFGITPKQVRSVVKSQ